MTEPTPAGPSAPASRPAWQGLLPAGIRARLFMLVTLVLLPLVLLQVWIYNERYEVRRAQALQTELEVAQGVANAFGAYLDDIRRTSHAVGLAVGNRYDRDREETLELLRQTAAQNRAIRSLSWVAPDGQVLASSDPRLEGRNLSGRAYLRAVVAGAPWSLDNLLRGSVADGRVAVLATGVRVAGDRLLGVAVAAIEPVRLGELALQRPASGSVAIFDRQGALVYRGPGKAPTEEERVGWIDADPVLRHAIDSGRAQVGVSRERGGGDAFAARVPIEGLGWVAGASRPIDEALAPVFDGLRRDALLALLACTLGFALAYLVARTISAPVRRLEQSATAADEGNLPHDPLAPAEVATLRATLTRLALERAGHERAQREAAQRFRSMADAVPSLLFETAPDGANTWISESWAGYSGAPPPGADRGWMTAIHPEDEPQQAARWEASRRAGSPFEARLRLRDAAGNYRWFLVRALPQHDGNGRIVRWVGSATDVDALVRAEEELRLATGRFEAALNSSPVVVFNQDLDLRYTWIANPQLGLRPADVVGKFDRDLFERDDAARLEAIKREVIAAGQGRRAEIRLQVRGEERHFGLNVEPLRDAAGRIAGVTCAATDLTAHKLVEAALRASEQQARSANARLEAVMQTAQVGICVADDPSCRFVRGNAYAQVLFGMTESENLSATPPPPAHTAFRLLRDGAPLPGEELPMQRAARRGEPVLGMRLQVVRADGGLSEVISSAAPLRDETGAVSGAVATFTDVTALSRAEELLREADRRKDEFLATLSHELRNPLAPLRTGLQVLRMKGADSVRRAEVQTIMERQVAHLVRLIDDLLDLSRITTGKLRLKQEPVDLGEVLRLAVQAVEPLMTGRRHRLRLALPSGALPVTGDPVRLNQVASNLLTNAAKYTPEGGEILVWAERDGRQVEFGVRDNGVGIPPDKLGAIFDLFTQAHGPPGHGEDGLGIGLNLVKKLVEMHGGTVRARSGGPGQGSEFAVRLPLAAATVRPAPPAPALRAGGRKLKVLAVDDNSDVTYSEAILLELTGHQVQTAHDGEAALKAAERVRPDVVLLDLSMPGLDGYEVARLVRARDWGRRVCLVAVSGWRPEDADRERAARAGFDHHLVKPVDPRELERILDACAGRRG